MGNLTNETIAAARQALDIVLEYAFNRGQGEIHLMD